MEPFVMIAGTNQRLRWSAGNCNFPQMGLFHWIMLPLVKDLVTFSLMSYFARGQRLLFLTAPHPTLSLPTVDTQRMLE
jgi:hypothetical protein